MKLEQVVSRASYILSLHAQRSGFEPIGMELGFGPNKALPPLTFTLKNGAKMELQGRIDRVDKAENENGVYLRVVDYKSSPHQLDLTDVYYGLDLQMLTYLDILMTYSKDLIGKESLPAGVLYFHLHNPVVSSSKILTMEEIEEEILKSFRMRGLMLDSPEVLSLMDSSLESGNSTIVAAGLKKDGQLTARSEVASKEDFEAIRNYVRNIYTKAGNDIVSGVVDIAPYKIKKSAACQMCPFKSVCQFDQSMEENKYRLISPQKQEDILAKMREEAFKQDENPYTT
jgi:ATP-dependent helicase/nuclease subunit B